MNQPINQSTYHPSERYGSRRLELVQISVLQSLFKLSADFEARSQVRFHRALVQRIEESASAAADAAASIDDDDDFGGGDDDFGGMADERHYARVVVLRADQLLRRLDS